MIIDEQVHIDAEPMQALYRRPGFMLRRAHQIAVSVFMAETAELGVTTTQYGVLTLLDKKGGLDQASVARLLGLDRSTTALVVRKLETRGLIGRTVDIGDRRRHRLVLTPSGCAMLADLRAPAQRAVTQLMSPLTSNEQATLLTLLGKLNTAFNTTARVPLLAEEANVSL